MWDLLVQRHSVSAYRQAHTAGLLCYDNVCNAGRSGCPDITSLPIRFKLNTNKHNANNETKLRTKSASVIILQYLSRKYTDSRTITRLSQLITYLTRRALTQLTMQLTDMQGPLQNSNNTKTRSICCQFLASLPVWPEELCRNWPTSHRVQ